MSYEILEVPKSEQIVIRDVAAAKGHTENQLLLQNHRDLLQLRARINAYIDTLHADGTTAAPALNEDEMISTAAASAEAKDRGVEIVESTLRHAATRGTIPGAEKRGGRWYMPRRSFEIWLEGHSSRK